jgi:hypothetical protein
MIREVYLDPGSGSKIKKLDGSRIRNTASTVKRGKIGHLITFRSKLKIVIGIFLDFCAGKVCMNYGTSVSKA